MRKRILVLTDYYLPGYRAGGPVRSLSNLIKAIPAEYEWHVITRDRDLGDTEPYAAVPVGQWVTVGPARVYYASPGQLRPLTLRRLIREVCPDLLYLNSYFSPRFSLWPVVASWLRLLPDTALLLAPRGEFSPGALELKPVRKTVVLALSRILGLHDHLAWHASTAEESVDILRALRRPDTTIHIANNLGTMVSEQFPGPPGTQADAPSQGSAPLRVCFLSRLSRKKNLDYALRILAQVRVPVHFTIYGPLEDPAYWAECQALAAALPAHVSVEVAGAVPHEQVHQRLATHDLLFLPTRGENYGHVLSEALSTGLALLTSDQTPWRDLTAKGLGHDLPLSDPGAFVSAIEAMAAETVEERTARRQRCRAYAQRLLRDAGALQAHLQMFTATLRTVVHSD